MPARHARVARNPSGSFPNKLTDIGRRVTIRMRDSSRQARCLAIPACALSQHRYQQACSGFPQPARSRTGPAIAYTTQGQLAAGRLSE